MFTFPRTQKGIQARIARYKTSMAKEKRAHGAIDDGTGKRYVLFWLYFVLGDLPGAKAYVAWYEREFSDDVGEPVQKLCWALMLQRMGNESEAKYRFADLMLANLYVVPRILGVDAPPQDVSYSSSYAALDYAEDTPAEVLGAITESEMEWMADLYGSFEFRRMRERHIELSRALANCREPSERTALRREASSLLDGLREACA